MQAEFSPARYELITNHALALAGVLSAEVRLQDAENGELRLMASSIADSLVPSHPPDPSPATDSRQPASLLDGAELAAFFALTLAEPGLHQRHVTSTHSNLVHVVAGRIEARGQVLGVMTFVLEDEPNVPELGAIEA